MKKKKKFIKEEFLNFRILVDFEVIIVLEVFVSFGS